MPAAGRGSPEGESRAGGGVDLVPVVHLDDLDVVGGIQGGRHLLDQAQQQVDAQAHVRGPDDRDALGMGLEPLGLAGIEAGGADHVRAAALGKAVDGDGNTDARTADENSFLGFAA